MSQWTEGYVADVPYTPGYYRELSPTLLALNLAIKGIKAPDLAKPFDYCELGFGQGLSLTTHAAAFPQARFWGTDFNPAHADHARGWARAGGLSNLQIFDDSFEQLLQRELPPLDFIVLHGIYSWISPETRMTIVDFIDRRLKPGGVVYVSYNALPGWSAAAPLRNLMRLHSERLSPMGLPMLDKVAQAVAFVTDLNSKNLRYFKGVPGMDVRIERLQKANKSYIAHEYFNRDWHPQYFYEVAGEMSAARLNFAGAGQMADNVDAAVLPAEALRALAEIPDAIMRETVKDYFLNTQFRRDIFVRGANKLPADEQSDYLMSQEWLMVTARNSIAMKIPTVVGDITLNEAAFKPVLDRLESGPASTNELIAIPEISDIGINRLLQGLVLLSSVGYLHPMSPPAIREAAMAPSQRYNAAIAAHGRDGGATYVACPLSGQGIVRSEAALGMSHFYLEGMRESQQMAEALTTLLAKRGQQVTKNGKPIESPDEQRAMLLSMAEKFINEEVPQIRKLGLLP